MKIIIAGAGKVGHTVAETLSYEGHDITVIDQDPGTIQILSNSLDVICVEGSATNPETLQEAGAETADLLLAATEKDEVNMVCGISARKLGTRHVVGRIRDPEYLKQTNFLRDALGLDVILNPEYECAMEISRVLRFPSAVRVDAQRQGPGRRCGARARSAYPQRRFYSAQWGQAQRHRRFFRAAPLLHLRRGVPEARAQGHAHGRRKSGRVSRADAY